MEANPHDARQEILRPQARLGVSMLVVHSGQGAEAVMKIDGATDAELVWFDGAAALRPTKRLGDMYGPGQVAFAQRCW